MDDTGGGHGLIEGSVWFLSSGAEKLKENYSLYSWCTLRYSKHLPHEQIVNIVTA
jgi:hypothetical protein